MSNLKHALPPDKLAILEAWIEAELAKDAQGIEAATAAETVQLGSVHESPVLEEDAPRDARKEGP